MVTRGDLAWAGEHTAQYIGDVVQKCAPKTCVTPMNSIQFLKDLHHNNQGLHKAKKLRYELAP